MLTALEQTNSFPNRKSVNKHTSYLSSTFHHILGGNCDDSVWSVVGLVGRVHHHN